MSETTLAKIDEQQKSLSNVTTISQAKRILSIAQGYVIAAFRQYKTADTLPEAKDDKEVAYDIASKAGELRLRAEARLGELIKQEQDAGRLASKGRPDNSDNDVRFLKDYGLTEKESSRAQQIAEHQDLIEKVVSQASKQKELPTRKALDRLIPKTPPSPPPPQITLDNDLNIITGDYSELYGKLADNSVDLFFTDPPYDKESIYLFGELAKLAQSKLKPGGLCLTYAPHPHLPSVIKLLEEYLEYWWIFSVIQTGNQARIWKNKLWVGWKPMLVFTKKPSNGRITDIWFLDSFRGWGEDKRYHEWGQDIHEATYWIESLVPIGGLVVDPFCGGGTIPMACKITNRQYTATEIDPGKAAIARKRIQEANNGTCSSN